MTHFSIKSLVLVVAVSLGVWCAIAATCLLVGSTGLGWPATAFDLKYRSGSVLLASLIGAGLACAGVAYQAILRNALADPYLLGVSSGASLACYVWRFAAIGGVLAGAISLQVFAFAGAVASISVVFAMASRRGKLEPVALLLVGVIVNAINGSIFLLINALRPELTGQGGGPIGFLVGGIQSNLETGQIVSAGLICLVGFIVLLWLAPGLNVAGLSEGEALSLGVSIQKVRWIGLLTASLMTAAVVAISGPIGFVGLVCPHLARLIVGYDCRRLLPLSAALGAGLLAVADALSRGAVLTMKTMPQVGILTGLLGGPFFLVLLYRQRQASAMVGT